MPEIKEIQAKELDSHLGKHTFEIVDISASWCPPCRALKQKGFPALFKKFPNKDLVVYGIDGDEAQEQMGNDPKSPIVKYHVTAYPTCIIHYKGKQVSIVLENDEEPLPPGMFLGYRNEGYLIALLEKVFKWAETHN